MFTCEVHCLQALQHMRAHLVIKPWVFVKFLIYTYLRYREKHGKYYLLGCCHLQTCKAVVNMLKMGLAQRQSFMVVPTTGMHWYPSSYSSLSFYIKRVPLLLFACKLHCLQTFEHTNAHWVMKIWV